MIWSAYVETVDGHRWYMHDTDEAAVKEWVWRMVQWAQSKERAGSLPLPPRVWVTCDSVHKV